MELWAAWLSPPDARIINKFSIRNVHVWRNKELFSLFYDTVVFYNITFNSKSISVNIHILSFFFFFCNTQNILRAQFALSHSLRSDFTESKATSTLSKFPKPVTEFTTRLPRKEETVQSFTGCLPCRFPHPSLSISHCVFRSYIEKLRASQSLFEINCILSFVRSDIARFAFKKKKLRCVKYRNSLSRTNNRIPCQKRHSIFIDIPSYLLY